MNIALIVFASLLAFAAIGSAIAKLLKVPDVMAAMASVGVKPNQVPMLAVLEIAGGVGIISGIWAPKLALAASLGLLVYFVGAVSSHIRVKSKMADAGAATGILIISIVNLVLQLKR